MYRVLLVDDEQIVRVSLRTLIDWAECGCGVPDAVADGESALASARERMPDIIITDLKMPKMDGLALIKKLNEEGYTGKIIVMSGYGDFELVREALRSRVFDYILKATVKPDEFSRIIKRAAGELRAEGRYGDSSGGESAEKVADRLRLLSFFSGIVPFQGEGPPERVCGADVLSAAGGREDYAFSAPYNMLYVFLEDSLMDCPPSAGRAAALLPILEELLCRNYFCLCAASDTAAAVLFEKDSFPVAGTDGAFFKKIYAAVKMYMNCECGFVFSEPFSMYSELEKIRDLCRRTSELTLYFGYGLMLRTGDVKDYSRVIVFDSRRVVNDVKALISTGNYDEAVTIFLDSIDYLKSSGNSPAETRSFLFAFLENLVIEYSIYFEKDSSVFFNFTDAFARATTAEQYAGLMRQIVTVIRENLFVGKKTVYRKEVQSIIDFIKANIGRRITLTMIGENSNMAESYVSRLFKNETGTNIVNYINTVKMEGAKELLRNPGILVKQVADSLGFDEQSYFNRMFNKYCGMSPSEYKKRYSVPRQEGRNDGK